MNRPKADPDKTAFDPVAAGRSLLRTARWGTLASLSAGAPYASLVTVATDTDGTPLVLISQLAVHTRNVRSDPRVSLLLASVGDGDPLSHPRISMAARAERSDDGRVRRRFLVRHPAAELYAGFADFSFWRLVPEGAHLVAGFGRIVDLEPRHLLTDLTGADDLVAGEAAAVAHMNEDHADALSLYAVRLLGQPDGPWRATGLDPDGLDLDDGTRTVRLPFPRRVASAGVLRQVLKALADEARASG